MDAKVAILGAGAWGTAVGKTIADKGIDVVLWSFEKDVADDIGMHESTVSRITTHKYVATPHGILELKFFFNSALGKDDGDTVGSESVKDLIRKIIDAEDPKKPVSDDAIADMLKDKLQVNIARRTVAKYRTSLGIESSSKRRDLL